MVEKSSLKEKKQKTAQIIKASLLPRLREQADQAILKDFVFDIMRMLKENNGKSENVLFGMKSAQRAIRRRQAKLVLVDSLLPKCISGEFLWLIPRSLIFILDGFAGFKRMVVVDGLEAKMKKSIPGKKLKRINFVTFIGQIPEDLFVEDTNMNDSFRPNIDIYSVTKVIPQKS